MANNLNMAAVAWSSKQKKFPMDLFTNSGFVYVETRLVHEESIWREV